MSNDTYKFQLRMPQDLSDRIKDIAKSKDTSLNQEIVFRLEESLKELRDPLNPITAEEAKKLAEQGAINTRNNLFRDCMVAISKEAETGSQEAWVGADMEGATDEVLNKVLHPVMKQLKELGYRCEYREDCIVIKF